LYTALFALRIKPGCGNKITLYCKNRLKILTAVMPENVLQQLLITSADVRIAAMQKFHVRQEIEPGILPVFRLFVVFQLAEAIWGFFRNARTNHTVLGEKFPRLLNWIVERQIDERFFLIWIVVLLFFLLFLSLPKLQRWLKQYYLPLALILQIIIFIFYNDWIAFARLSEQTGTDIGARNWQMFVLLSIPVLLASWQYSFWVVLLYIGFSGVLDFFFLHIFGTTTISKNLLMILWLIFRSIMYGLIGFIVTRLMKEQRKLRHSLQEANQKLTHYVSALDELATVRERNRLARELHDILAHTLSGLVIQLESINILWDRNSEEARRELQASTTRAREGLNETRQAIKSLRASPLSELGLPLALHRVAENAALRGGFQVTINIPENLSNFPHKLANDLYSVALEAFENIVQHAQASHARLSIEFDGKNLRLEITDDGHGFDPGAVEMKSHFGLLGLRERAELHGANFNVASQSGQGTRISLSLEVQ
jgi:signal transduction histidine kinase